MRGLGLFGGTFNPIHSGHLIVAEDARELLCLEKIIFIPSYIPPHKKQITSSKHRYRMAELAIKNNPNFEISDIELKRKGRSYTVDTLREFKKRYTDFELYFLMGVDQLLEIETWKTPDEVFRLCKVVVLSRPGYEIKNSRTTRMGGYDLMPIEVTLVDISSTEIKKRVADGRSFRYLVPQNVEEYIKKNRLYVK